MKLATSQHDTRHAVFRDLILGRSRLPRSLSCHDISNESDSDSYNLSGQNSASGRFVSEKFSLHNLRRMPDN